LLDRDGTVAHAKRSQRFRFAELVLLAVPGLVRLIIVLAGGSSKGRRRGRGRVVDVGSAPAAPAVVQPNEASERVGRDMAAGADEIDMIAAIGS
jgi:hypothetical protein